MKPMSEVSLGDDETQQYQCDNCDHTDIQVTRDETSVVLVCGDCGARATVRTQTSEDMPPEE